MSKHHVTKDRAATWAARPPAALSRGQFRRQQQHTRRRPRLGIGLGVLLLLLAGLLVLGLPRLSQASGTLGAPQTSHDFGRVPLNGGLIRTQFALDVQGPVQVVGLDST